MDNVNASKKVNKELKLGVVLSYLLIGLTIVSGLLLVPFIINGLGESNYGVYNAASSLIAMFVVDLGLGTAVTKFVSKYRVTSNQEEINKITSVVFACFIFLAAILLIIFGSLFPFLKNIYSSFTPEEVESLKYVFIIVVAYTVLTFPFSIVNGILVSYDKIFLTKIADIISKLVFIILTILVLVFNLGLYFLTACYAVHGVLSVAIKLFFVKTKTPTKFFYKIKWQEFKQIFKDVISFSIWAAINSFGRVILVSVAPMILGFASPFAEGTTEITIFSNAARIESYVSLFATAFGSIFYPSISRILFKDSDDYTKSLPEFHRFHIKIARIQVLILSIMLAGLVIFGKDFIYLWLGSGFDKSYYCMIALCLPALFFYPLQIAENAIAAVEKIKHCGLATIISTVVGIGASIGLAFPWGAIGVSIGICIGFITRTILFNIIFNRYLKINPLSFYFKSYVSFLIPVAISVVVGVILNKMLPDATWIYFLIKVFIASICYIACVCVVGLNSEERGKFDQVLVRTYNKVNSLLRKVEK